MPARRRSFLVRIYSFIRIVVATADAWLKLRAVSDPYSTEGRKKIRELSFLWTQRLALALKVEIQLSGVPPCQEPCLYVANHLGFLDIPMLMSAVDLAYVGKVQVSRWPIFGPAASAGGTVWVDRSNAESRKLVGKTIGNYIKERKRSVGLFPEGTSSLYGKDWKPGAFVVAKEFGFRIQPVCLHYVPLRPAAYIDDDLFVQSLWKLLGQPNLKCSIEFLEAEHITDVAKDTARLQAKVRESFMKKQQPYEMGS